MEGSASEIEQGVQAVEQNYAEFEAEVEGIQEVPNFSLTEMYSLIVILSNLTVEILQQFENVRLEIIIDSYCNPVALACKKIKKVNKHFIYHLKIIFKGH